MAVVVFMQPYTVFASDPTDRSAALLDTVWAGGASCATDVSPATTGTGPLMGVNMPDVSDLNKFADNIDKFIALKQANSPLKGRGKDYVSQGSHYNINPALAVAQADHETSLGTAGVALTNKNAYGLKGNGAGGFQSFSDIWDSAIAYYKNISTNPAYKDDTTIAELVHTYSPDSDPGNGAGQEADYVKALTDDMTQITAGLDSGDAGATSNPTTSFLDNKLVPQALAAPPTNGSSGAVSDELNGYKLPATQGGSGVESATTNLALGDPKTPDELKYYINMRWEYAKWDWDGNASSIDTSQYNWMVAHHPRILVSNPRTGKNVIADALEAGPAPWTGTKEGQGNPPSYWQQPQLGTPSGYDGRVSGLAPTAFHALGTQEWTNGRNGDTLNYDWAPDQTAPLGPTNLVVGSATGPDGGPCTTGEGGDGSNSTIVQDALNEFNLHLVGTGSLSNSGPVCKYQGSACGEAWCADFVSWVYKEAGKPFTGGQDGGWRLSLASDTTGYFLARKGQSGIGYGTPSGGDPMEPGWVVSFTGVGGGDRGIGHVGIVTQVNSNGTFDDVEGNGSGPGVTYNHNLSKDSAIDWGGYK